MKINFFKSKYRNPVFNKFNRIDKITIKSGSSLTKDGIDKALNDARSTIVSFQNNLINVLKRDKTVDAKEIQKFSECNPNVWPPKKVLSVIVYLYSLKDDIKKRKII